MQGVFKRLPQRSWLQIPIGNKGFSGVGLAIFALVAGALGSYFLFFSHASPSLPGDINNDDTVSILDVSLLLSSYAQNRTTCATNTSYTCDVNGDNTVNVLDLSVLLSNYGKSASAAAPTNTILPAISGTAVQDQTLSAAQGTWTNSPTNYTYQWQRCDSAGSSCSAVGSATAASYLLTANDVSRTIRVVVTATNTAGLASATSAQTAIVTTTSSSSKLGWSSAFYPGWTQYGSPPSTLPWNAITHLIQFSLLNSTSRDGTINTSAHSLTPSYMQAAVAAAHQHNVKILISIGGAEDNNWDAACSAVNRSKFVTSLVGIMQQYSYDGIDLDIEQDWGGDAHTDFIACVATVRNALNAISPRPILTEDFDPDWQAYMAGPVWQYLDQVNLMSYYGNAATIGTSITNNYLSRGIPASKIGMGLGNVAGDGSDTTAAACTAKAQYAINNHLGGLMTWIISGGSTDAPCFSAIATYVPTH